MKSNIPNRILVIASLLVFAMVGASAAQDTGGGGGGTGGGGGATTGGGTTGGGATGTGGVVNTGNNLGGGGGGGLQLPDAFDLTDNLSGLDIEIPEFEDNRNQGFVGVTSDRIDERGFVGGLSQFAGGSSEGSFGGGANAGSGRSAAGGGRAGAGRATGGTQLGFEVVRPKYIRAKMRPAFSVPRRAPEQVVNRFVSHARRLPEPIPTESIQVEIQDGVATISGSVASAEQAEKIERQLRLEPGVYRIVNRLVVGQ